MRRSTKIFEVVRFVLLGVVILFCIFPFYYMVTMSFKQRIDIVDPSTWIFKPTISNYIKIIFEKDIFLYFKNSLIVVVSTTIISCVLGSMAAYGFARYRFRRKEDLAFFILSLRMFPPMAAVIPFFILATFIGLFDTHLILIIVYLTFNIPFSMWIMRGFFEEIPKEIEEAAMIDGASHLKTFTKVVLPLVAPGMAATVVLCFIQSWNEFALALFLTSLKARTLPTTVTFFLAARGIVWGQLAAVSTITTLPVIVFAFLVQKNLVRGLTFGALK